MDWKQELDALIQSTMAFAQDIKREPIRALPVAMKLAEQALAEPSKPIPPTAIVATMGQPVSERDEIRKHVSNFRAHQEKMAKDREDFYLQAKAKMMSPPAGSPLG